MTEAEICRARLRLAREAIRLAALKKCKAAAEAGQPSTVVDTWGPDTERDLRDWGFTYHTTLTSAIRVIWSQA